MTRPEEPKRARESGPGLVPDDSGRVEAYLRGDAKVFEEVEQWVRSELRHRYPGLGHEHEDLCQTVHGKLLTNLRAGRYEGRSGLRTYVTGIAHHTAIDRLRERYRWRALTDSLTAEPEPARSDPYRALENLDESKLLHRAMMSLPNGCRELWRLAFLDKLSYEEIGRRLTIPPGTVKSRMWHCRRKAMSALRRLRLSQSLPGPI